MLLTLNPGDTPNNDGDPGGQKRCQELLDSKDWWSFEHQADHKPKRRYGLVNAVKNDSLCVQCYAN